MKIHDVKSAKNMQARLIYALLVVFTIVTGLLSRRNHQVPLFVGDVLWVTMAFFMLRFALVNDAIKRIVVFSLLFCYGIEFSQLYKAPWINQLRHTLFGRLVLGETFLWGDLLSYTLGIALAVCCSYILQTKFLYPGQPFQ